MHAIVVAKTREFHVEEATAEGREPVFVSPVFLPAPSVSSVLTAFSPFDPFAANGPWVGEKVIENAVESSHSWSESLSLALAASTCL